MVGCYLLLTNNSLLATTYTFNGSNNTDWATASNWSTNVVPTTVILVSGDAVVIAANCTMNDVVITFPSGASFTVNSGKALSPSLNTYITISSGATLTVQATGSIYQGRITNSGTMDISGSYSAFYMTNQSGGILNILSGGSYTCPACAESFQVGGTINNSGTMHVGTGSTWQGTINNNVGGVITDGGNGAQIQLGASSTMNNYGSFVSRTAGTSGTFYNYSTGTLTMPGTCNFAVKNGSTFTNDGTVTLPSSDNFFNINSGGTVTNNATFKGIGTMVQSGSFNNSGAASIAPGNSPGTLTVNGNFTLGGTLDLEANGKTADSYDVLVVNGTAFLGGAIKLNVGGGYVPANNDQITVLSANAISGTFSSQNLPANWYVNYVGNSVVLTFGAPLPVEMVSFKGKLQDDAAQLEWQTAAEINNQGFHIERMVADGERWEEIGFVPGSGTTNETHDYSFLDEKPLPGLNYYRLRQIDYDGKEELSKIVSVTLKKLHDLSNLRFFPNPVKRGELTFVLPETLTDKFRVHLFSATGMLVGAATFGNGTNKLDVSNLAAGIYTLEIWNSSERIVEKIVVQK